MHVGAIGTSAGRSLRGTERSLTRRVQQDLAAGNWRYFDHSCDAAQRAAVVRSPSPPSWLSLPRPRACADTGPWGRFSRLCRARHQAR